MQPIIRSTCENHGQLKSLMSEVCAADLKLVPRKADSPALPYHHHHQPPVTYMHICETDHFSMGVFLLKSGSSIPLHDHPGMHGVLKVLYGKVRIRCFDRLERPSSTPPPPPRPQSGPCVLSPDRDNLHQIDAVDGPTAFMDILAPPYDPDNGRDCHYYTVLAEVEGQQQQPGQEVWLREVSQPADFWCGAEPYPGPQVCL
uniref:2-aminoethanethiol dioxygenase n=1 Tax=Neogobius melanostomus TaxID=47308 RepID=A0A8C6SIC4_9GOBI